MGKWFGPWSLFNLRSQDILRVALFVCAAILVPGWLYWHSTGANVAECLFGTPQCSATLGTYLLCGLSVLAFCAAFEAVQYAGGTLRESAKAAIAARQSAEMATRAAINEETCHLAGSRCADLRCAECRSGLRKDVYEDRLSADPTIGRRPPGRRQSEFLDPIRMDIVCMGRSPAINAVLWLEVTLGERSGRGRVPIGSLQVNQKRHLDIFIHRDLAGAEVSWGHDVQHDGPRIDFSPEERQLTQAITEIAEQNLPRAEPVRPQRPRP
jgi:hypothetical protein